MPVPTSKELFETETKPRLPFWLVLFSLCLCEITSHKKIIIIKLFSSLKSTPLYFSLHRKYTPYFMHVEGHNIIPLCLTVHEDQSNYFLPEPGRPSVFNGP